MLQGAIEFLKGTDDLLALVRSPEQQQSGNVWLCVFNFTDSPLRVTLSDAPQSTAHALDGLPPHQVGERINNEFILPPYGIYWGAVH
jgi:hypothetical protein